jgi:hypothetical protein
VEVGKLGADATDTEAAAAAAAAVAGGSGAVYRLLGRTEVTSTADVNDACNPSFFTPLTIKRTALGGRVRLCVYDDEGDDDGDGDGDGDGDCVGGGSGSGTRNTNVSATRLIACVNLELDALLVQAAVKGVCDVRTLTTVRYALTDEKRRLVVRVLVLFYVAH